MTIPESIHFLVTELVTILSSEVVFPFVGIWIAAYVIYLVFHMMGRR